MGKSRLEDPGKTHLLLLFVYSWYCDEVVFVFNRFSRV